jgi:NodT family efflux transporter outer membrane factor (OMF) lipoprotein
MSGWREAGRRHRRRPEWTWKFQLCLAGILCCVGCTVGPKYHRAPVQVPPEYKSVGNWKAAQPSQPQLTENWWEMFQDPQLNALEEQANVTNQNLKASVAQYTQARALLRFYRADYYPTIIAAPTYARTRFSANRQPRSPVFNGITVTDVTIPFELQYQADVFGRIRSNVQSFRAQAQASYADLATVNLSVHASLAVFYFSARSLDAQEKLLYDTVDQYQQALDLTQSRYAGGLASEVEVQQAETQLQTVIAQAIDVGVQRAQYVDAIATLIGKPASSFSLGPLPLTAPPPPIPSGLPSELLERRPDIAAAERLMASANAEIGVAKSAYYPVFNITSTGGFESGVVTTLFSGPSILWSVGASAAVTVFDVGRRRALSDAAIAAYDTQVAK